MKMIQPNCRIQFTAADIAFIIRALGREANASEQLVPLLADLETRDLILDDEALFRALIEQCGCLSVSSHLYFYVLVRHVLRRAGIEDRDVADYVAEILAEFSRVERTLCRVPGRTDPIEYFFEMLGALQTADSRTRFYIQAHIGNYSLFLSGVFPDRIRSRAETRGFPDLRYYEQLGRANYRRAGDHRLARQYELEQVYAILSERFQPARRALNDLSERLISLGDPEVSL